MNPFVDADLRISRAKDQFNSLRGEVTEWLNRRTYSLTFRVDANTGENVVEVSETEPIPPMWSIIATEIVHHFRSALDNAIHALTIAHSGAAMKGTEFPIFDNQKGFDGQGKIKMRGVSPACQAFIESIQPFHKAKPDEHLLWGIQELSNAEKHQSLPLLEIFRHVEVTGVEPFGGVEVVDVKYGPPGPLKAGTEVVRWKVARVVGKGHVTADFKLARDILLDVARPPVLAGTQLMGSLNLMGETTATILRYLKDIHSPPPSP